MLAIPPPPPGASVRPPQLLLPPLPEMWRQVWRAPGVVTVSRVVCPGQPYWGQRWLTCAQVLTTLRPDTRPLARALGWHTELSLPSPHQCRGGGGTHIDNEIFGTLGLWERPPASSFPCPGRGRAGSPCRMGTAGQPACSQLWGSGCAAAAQTCFPGVLSGPPQGAMRGPRHASRLVTDR